MSAFILDASALLAMIFEEKGGDLVAKRLPYCHISAVNLTEVASRLVRDGMAFDTVHALLGDLNLHVVDYTPEMAMIAAGLYPETVHKGLSTGDRACLALAIATKTPILTADKAWAGLKLGIKIEVIR